MRSMTTVILVHFPCLGGAATPHGAPAEADGSLYREGPVPLGPISMPCPQ
jgi:hypothetical protein